MTLHNPGRGALVTSLTRGGGGLTELKTLPEVRTAAKGVFKAGLPRALANALSHSTSPIDVGSRNDVRALATSVGTLSQKPTSGVSRQGFS